MKVAAIQSSFIPWRGYFDCIASVDQFVFLDDIQYTHRDWRNRNKIKTSNGTEWVSVPVVHDQRSQTIDESRIQYQQNWQKKIAGAWDFNYRSSPYYEEGIFFVDELNQSRHITISQLNISLIKKICNYLSIETPMILSRDLNLQGRKTERIINLLKQLNATTYISGPSADAYLDKDAFRQNNIRLEYKTYDYTPYPQRWGDFIGDVTIMDLIANCGQNARRLISSKSSNIIIID